MDDRMDARDIQKSICQLQVVRDIVIKAEGKQDDDVQEILRQLDALEEKMTRIYENHKHEILRRIDGPRREAAMERILDTYMESYRKDCLLSLAHDITYRLGKEIFPSPFEFDVSEIDERLSGLAKRSRDETARHYRDLMSRFPAQDEAEDSQKG